MQTVLGNGNLYACWMLSLSSRKSSTATVPLQVFPAAGGRTVERMLYASLLRQTVARYPPETPHSPCHHQTSPIHLTETAGKRGNVNFLNICVHSGLDSCMHMYVKDVNHDTHAEYSAV